jgi:hypothetical protein
MSRDTFTTTPAEAPLAGRTARSGALARLAAFARTERGIVTIALGLVALHIADDNFIQPEPGTSPPWRQSTAASAPASGRRSR